VARIMARNPERAVHSALSGTQVRSSVQVAGPQRNPGLLVMRKSRVRFPERLSADNDIGLCRLARLGHCPDGSRLLLDMRLPNYPASSGHAP
jgi:hypothetical protein